MTLHPSFSAFKSDIQEKKRFRYDKTRFECIVNGFKYVEL